MTLESVWAILENGEWESKQALREASGDDEDTLSRIINFLHRWNFVDIQNSPNLLVRRKPGTISPLETFDLLRAITNHPSPSSTRRKLAERVACRVCGERNLRFIGANEVECARCHEKQWFALETKEPFTQHKEVARSPDRLHLASRILIRLGFPQRAFRTTLPKALQYFWFRCTSCGKVSTDYPHSYSRYLTCQSCGCHNHFW